VFGGIEPQTFCLMEEEGMAPHVQYVRNLMGVAKTSIDSEPPDC